MLYVYIHIYIYIYINNIAFLVWVQELGWDRGETTKVVSGIVSLSK